MSSRITTARRVTAIFAVALATGWPATSPGGQAATSFRELDSGLPGPTVTSIEQDRTGYLWFGTESGLVRFDGFRTTVYRHDPADPHSLADDSVMSLLTDRMGNLWVGTSGGLSRYDPRRDAFENFRHDPADPNSIASDMVFALAEDPSGSLWIGGIGLSRMNPATRRFDRFTHDPSDAASLSHDFVYVTYVDPHGRIWIGTNGGGLDRFDTATGAFEHIELGPLQRERNQLHMHVRSILEDRSGSLWVGSDGGLNRLNLETGTRIFYPYNYDDPADPHSLTDNYTNALLEDRQGNLWIGTYQRGVARFDQANNRFIRYQHDPSNPNSLRSDLIYDIYEDRTGLLWFAGEGVHSLDPISEKLTVHNPPPGHPTAAVASAPTSLVVDELGQAWLGNRRGLIRYHVANERWTLRLLVPEHPHYPDNNVYAIHAGRDSYLYTAVPQSIAVSLRHVESPFGLISLRGTPNVIYEDRAGELWAGVPFVGLAHLVGDQQYLVSDPNDPQSLSENFINFLLEDNKGRFWVGAANGLNLLDRATGQFERYSYEPANPNGLGHYNLRAAAEDRFGNLWLGTGRGLDRFSPDTGQFVHYRTGNGLAHDVVNTVAVDQSGKVWAGTAQGLSRLDPATGEIQNFYVEHGLPDNRVLQLALAPTGELYIGTRRGLVSLWPDQVSLAPGRSTVSISTLELFNRPVMPGGGNAASPLAMPIEQTSEITLSHRDDIVSFELAVLDYRNPERNRYAYQLEGIDPDWVYTEGTNRKITYTTLPAGNYAFRYRGADSAGRWSDVEQSIRLTVKPAPWNSRSAYALYAALLIMGTIGVINARTRNARARARVLESTVRQRTRELREQTDTVEQQRERLQQVVAVKDRLYANVSHEFRTPLTLILGPIDRLLRREHSPQRREYLEAVRRNAWRLLRLVEQLMELARVDAGRTAQPAPQAAGRLVHTLVQSFETLADDKGIKLHSGPDPDAWVFCDADALEKIVVNLISNAIKFTPGGGEIWVGTQLEANDVVAITVSDTGIGIPEAEHGAVFDRFHRLNGRAEAAPGTGLGLALVKELVEANRGTITLTSSPGAGATFCVHLPRAEPAVAVQAARQVDAAEPTITNLEIASLRQSQPLLAETRPEAGRSSLLVIEDNRDLCRHLHDVLGDNFSCTFAHDGETGVEFATNEIPDLVVCDVMLPKVNGFEVTRQLKQDYRTCHIPVIMLTARADEESRLSGLRSLADAYVTKPFSEAELCQHVETLLAVRDILRERYSRAMEQPEPRDQVLSFSARDRRFMERLESVLEKHYPHPDFSLAQLASASAMSERQLQRKLRALTNLTPRSYIRNFRLRKAMEMLRAGERAGDVAFAAGFGSQSYFTSCFKAHFGATPTDVRHKPDVRQQ